MLLIVTLAGLFVACVYVVLRRNNCTHQSLANLPSYPALPLIGSGHYIVGDGRHLFQRLKEITETCEKTQLPFLVWFGSYCCLILSDIDDIKSVTNEFVEKPYYYKFARLWLGDGVLIASGPIWKCTIKKIAGAFNAKMVDNFQDIFNSQAQKLVQGLKSEVGRGFFNVLEKYLAETTLEAFCQIAFGVPKISDSIITKDYYAAFVKALEIIRTRGCNILLHSDLVFGLTSYKREFVKAIDKLHHVSDTVMKLRRQDNDTRKSNEEHNNKAENTESNYKSYLDLLLELNAKDPNFTMEQVKNDVNTIILAGQETVATSLFYILLMIGSYPDVQDKLYTEMKDIFGASKRDVGKEDLTRMTYCEAVIHETLRLYPPIPGFFREADHDLQLKSCKAPKGVFYLVNVFGVGRSKKYWGPDAEEFRPERFACGVTPPMIPFSTGRRACIGKKYAMPIMKTILAYCVRELVFETKPGKIELKIDTALRTVHEEVFQVKLRQQ